MEDNKKEPGGERPETLDGIVADILDRAVVADRHGARETSNESVAALLRDIADRIKAAQGRQIDENTSDGYHTFKELYRYRMLYNAAFFNLLARFTRVPVVKSCRHSDGEKCFGGGWFIVVAQLPTGQVSNHYEKSSWHLFDVPVVELAPTWDGHTPNDAADRLEAFLSEPHSALATGNAAELRNALIATVKLCSHNNNDFGSTIVRELLTHMDMIKAAARAALSTPARNCDVGTAEEQAERYGCYCDKFTSDRMHCETCPYCGKIPFGRCEFAWAQMPYEAAEKGGVE